MRVNNFYKIGILLSSLTLVNFATQLAARATAITITNPGFETTPSGNTLTAGNDEPYVSGWDVYNPDNLFPTTITDQTAGIFTIYTANVFYSNPPDGTNVAVVYLPQSVPPNPANGAGLQQTLTDSLTANTNYTLQVAVGNPSGTIAPPSDNVGYLTGFPGYQVQLLAGGNVIASDNNTLSPADGYFVTSTVSYTATSTSSYLGQPLGIRLINTDTSSGVDTVFDHVTLDATPVPTPPAFPAILLATGMGYGMRRRLKKLVKS